jgi:ribosomal protein S18 acetylase RimI-like enzyme
VLDEYNDAVPRRSTLALGSEHGVASIRPARPADTVAIADLIRSASEASFLPDLSEVGRWRFLSDHTSEAMASRLQSSEFRYDVAEEGGVLVGLVGVRSGTHLFSLYVAPNMQGRGLGRMLWNHVRDRSLTRPAAVFTVNSSTNAVPIYERFGFVATGATVDANGVLYVPMRFGYA